MIKEALESVSKSVLSILGSGVIIYYLFGFCVKKLLQNEKQKHDKALIKLRADLQQQINASLEQIKVFQQSKLDLLLRKRSVYESLIKSMRIFLSDSSEDKEEKEQQKREFLNNYDLSYLWASDEAINDLGELLGMIIENTNNPNPENQSKLKELYGKCLLEMRKDSGFSETHLKSSSYKFVSF